MLNWTFPHLKNKKLSVFSTRIEEDSSNVHENIYNKIRLAHWGDIYSWIMKIVLFKWTNDWTIFVDIFNWQYNYIYKSEAKLFWWFGDIESSHAICLWQFSWYHR